MKALVNLITILLLGLSINSIAQAGEVRLGIGLMEDINDQSGYYQYTAFDLGYDFNRIFGVTGQYHYPNKEDLVQVSDELTSKMPNQARLRLELGYTFGDNFSVRPYGTLGAVHMWGGEAMGNTGLAIGVGVRATIKFAYLDAVIEHLPEVNEGNDGTYWTWDSHQTATITLGVKF